MSCWICLDEHETRYHARCLKELFGVAAVPRVDVRLAKLHTLALAMVGHVSLSGVQRKISVGLNQDRTTLQVSIEGGRFILKPQASTFPHLPENEHVTMRIARLVGIEVPPCGLVELDDGSVAYVVLRFDRPARGGKLRQEDLCQLAEKSPKEKYEGSGELCARLLAKYATEPLVEVLRLYRLLAFTWWTGNGDMHLKNFSVLASPQGLQRLAPAYDLLCTRLVIPDDPLSLSVQGRKDKLRRSTWLKFADHCRLGRRAAERVLDEMAAHVDTALALVGRSALPDDFKESYADLLRARTRTLLR